MWLLAWLRIHHPIVWEKSLKITLREITKENYRDVCDLEVTNDQKGHLASNMESLVESKFDETLVPRAIYAEDKPVGFMMGNRASDTEVTIFRFMIDFNFQQKGIGRAALRQAITEIRQIEGIQQIDICYHPDNTIAKRLYLSLGFREVGMDESDEDMWAVLHI